MFAGRVRRRHTCERGGRSASLPRRGRLPQAALDPRLRRGRGRSGPADPKSGLRYASRDGLRATELDEPCDRPVIDSAVRRQANLACTTR